MIHRPTFYVSCLYQEHSMGWCIDVLAFPGTRGSNQRIDEDWQQRPRILMCGCS